MEKSSSGQVHRPRRKSKAHSKHEHKCHKARHKSTESLLEKSDRVRGRNSLTEKGNWSGLSLDSGLSRPETFPPLEINVGLAYEHVKAENDRLEAEVAKLHSENERFRSETFRMEEENENLKSDVTLMKNLVFKLNVELERYQSGGKVPDEGRQAEKLPKNYQKNFLKPVLPLLKAYSEALLEKNDVVSDLEKEYRKFNVAFNQVLAENERLYEELEKKFSGPEGDALAEVRILKKNLEMSKQENDLLYRQINLEREKLAKVHSTFKVKVEEVTKEKEDMNDNMEECRADLYLLRGKYAVLKQEFERLKMDNESRVPLAVHSASINECRKLFQDLKNEYESEKQRLTIKIKEQEGILKRQKKQEEDWEEERMFLEKSNFDQTVEIEGLKKKISEQVGSGGKVGLKEEERRKLSDSQRQLRESNRKVEELSRKLSITRKQLHKAMIFAEEIVRGQEGLLLQLHAKQKENNYMSTQFGSLKNQLKDVEKGAQEGLNSVEEKIRSLETENHALVMHNRKLEKLLAEKETQIRNLEPTKDFCP